MGNKTRNTGLSVFCCPHCAQPVYPARLSFEQASYLLNASKATLLREIDEGKILDVYQRGSRRITRTSLLTYMNSTIEESIRKKMKGADEKEIAEQLLLFQES